MARQLGDVLHYFLDDAPPPTPMAEERRASSTVAAPFLSDDTLRGAMLRALADEFRALGVDARVATNAMQGPDPKEPAQPAPGESLVLMHVPTDQSWDESVRDHLGHCWLAVANDAEGRRELLSVADRVFGTREDAHIGVTVRAASGLGTARDAFDGLAELFEARFARPLLSYGLVVGERALYRSRSRDLDFGDEAGSCARAARTLRDVALLLRGDLE